MKTASEFPDSGFILDAVKESEALKGSKPSRGLPSHDDCSPVDPDKAARALQPGGALGTGMEGYEMRPGQIDMLRAVTNAFNSASHLMIEAGTGVGKSLAYVIPSILWAYTNDTPVVVSTATKNLQSQLVASDIPRAAKVLEGIEDPSRPFRFALLKGRRNYVCLRAIDKLATDGVFAFTDGIEKILCCIAKWIKTSSSGEIDSLAGYLQTNCMSALVQEQFDVRDLTTPGEECSGRKCKYYSRCFVHKARDAASKAHLIAVNHSLVLAEALNSSSVSILPAYSQLVIDEAHDLEDIATDAFTFEFSQNVVKGLFRRLQGSPSSGRFKRTGILENVVSSLGKVRGGASSPDVMQAVETVAAVRRASAAAVRKADNLLDSMENLFPSDTDASQVRYRLDPADPEKRQYSLSGLFADCRESRWDEAAFRSGASAFESSFAETVDLVENLSSTLKKIGENESSRLFEDLISQLAGVRDAIASFSFGVKSLVESVDAQTVYWVERAVAGIRLVHGKRSGGKTVIKAFSAPLSVSRRLNEILYSRKDSVVMCSATLRIGGSFDYMAGKLGFDLQPPSRRKLLVADSPFDYFRQSLVLAPAFMPDPAAAAADYTAMLSSLLEKAMPVTRGRALVLFTAYDMMNAVAARAEGPLDIKGIKLLVQGRAVTREQLSDSLRTADSPTVVFGAQSFWEGVDIPGAALSCVVLARLPFPNVSEPVVAARCDAIASRGESPFARYMLPEAVVKFRQGFGRLIRSKRDSGVVIVADPRIVTKNYGSLFKKSIPASVHSVNAMENLIEQIGSFLG